MDLKFLEIDLDLGCQVQTDFDLAIQIFYYFVVTNH